MSAAQAVLSFAIWVSLVLSAAALLLTVWRVVKGPTLPDRVVALDMLVGIVIGFIALIAIRTGFTLYIDIAIALGLVGFLATIAFARFILASANRADRRDIGDLMLDGPPAAGRRSAKKSPKSAAAASVEAEPARARPAKVKSGDGKAAEAGTAGAGSSSARPGSRASGASCGKPGKGR